MKLVSFIKTSIPDFRDVTLYFRVNGTRDFRFSGMLRSVDLQLVTDVSKHPSGPETSVTNYKSTMCNNPEERRCNLYRGGSLTTRKNGTRLPRDAATHPREWESSNKPP